MVKLTVNSKADEQTGERFDDNFLKNMCTYFTLHIMKQVPSFIKMNNKNVQNFFGKMNYQKKERVYSKYLYVSI